MGNAENTDAIVEIDVVARTRESFTSGAKPRLTPRISSDFVGSEIEGEGRDLVSDSRLRDSVNVFFVFDGGRESVAEVEGFAEMEKV